jgi:hypothetical protein
LKEVIYTRVHSIYHTVKQDVCAVKLLKSTVFMPVLKESNGPTNLREEEGLSRVWKLQLTMICPLER